MPVANNIHEAIHSQAQAVIKDVRLTPQASLNQVLRLCAKYRAHLLQNTMIAHYGLAIQDGPFAGMEFVERVAEGCFLPKLLGCYEQELHSHIRGVLNSDYQHIIDIGCAEGYYAVGFARSMPNTKIHAYDTDRTAQEFCRTLAEKNDVSDRVHISGLFKGEDFAQFQDSRTLVFCDIEGAERALLDPGKYPALKNLDVIVELHEVLDPGIGDAICQRFESSHRITRVPHGPRDIPLPSMFNNLGHLDQLLAYWEWRAGPTPWAVMHAKLADLL